MRPLLGFVCAAAKVDRQVPFGEHVPTIDQERRRAMETEPLGILWRVDALVGDFNVVASDVGHRLAQALLGEVPVGTAIEELDGDSQDVLTVMVPLMPRCV